MNACARRDDVTQAVRSGRWPQGCAPELREHVAGCAACAEEARLTSAFAAAREGAMRVATPQSADLLWWKAQLRRRRSAMEQLERPAMAVSTVAISASVALLLGVTVLVWNRMSWPDLSAIFMGMHWSAWIPGPVAVLMGGFAVTAIAVGVGISKERG